MRTRIALVAIVPIALITVAPLAHISARTAALHDHNEDGRIPEILARLRAGQSVALVSDAGTPLQSDPGYRLVRAALAENLPVQAIPGANAAVSWPW